jgi:hypothetical protein
MTKKKLIALAFLSMSLGNGAAQSSGIKFSYKLQNQAHTSAGVFDPDGVLIRTLWSNSAQSPGFYTYFWDGADDGANAMPGGKTYTIKVLLDNVRYTWDGVIGNTESAWTTTTSIWDGLGYLPAQLKFAFFQDHVWASTGYSEGTKNLVYFSSKLPNTPATPNLPDASQNVQFVDIDCDGQYLYLANIGVWKGENYVTKLDAASASPALFEDGVPIVEPYSWSKVTLSGIDVSMGKERSISIAVQNQGNLLAVAHSDANQIRLFDKYKGSSSGSPISIHEPQSIAFTSAGLWVLSDSKVFLITDIGTNNTAAAPLQGLSNPVYVTTNKSNNHVFVLDGGVSQQVKEFDTNDRLVRVYGDRGGYLDLDPKITNTRLMLDSTATRGVGSFNRSWLRVSPNNELWICDGGNAARILHVSANNIYKDQILFGQEQYSVGTSRTSPTRVFRYSIEYAIDYSKPLLPGDPDPALGGNGSWKMVRNWAVGAEGAHGSTPKNFDSLGSIFYVERLSNGRTYGLLEHSGGDRPKRVYEFELPVTGPLRFTGYEINSTYGLELQPDGSLLRMDVSGSNPERRVTISSSALLGFDQQGNPLRAPFVQVAGASFNSQTETEPALGGWGMAAGLEPTSSGVFPAYQTMPRGLGYPHLSGIKGMYPTYIFKTLREKCLAEPDFHGSWPCAKSFGGHAGVTAHAVGNNIFAAYDGQYALYGNAYYHYWDDGLMIGQFGQLSRDRPGLPRVPADAGNIAMVRFVPYRGDIYMYLTAEAGFTPLQRWHISNIKSITEKKGQGSLGSELLLH